MTAAGATGSAGGKTLSWKGKVAIIFAATEVIDSHHSVIGAMGDRFLLSRLKPVAGRKQFRGALKHVGGSISQMRKELAGAVTRLFAKRRTEASGSTMKRHKRSAKPLPWPIICVALWRGIPLA